MFAVRGLFAPNEVRITARTLQCLLPNTAPRRYFAKGHKTSEEAGLGRGWYYIPPEDNSLDHLSEEDKIIKAFESTKEMLGLTGSAMDNFLEMALSSPTSDLTMNESGVADPDADLDKTFGDFKKQDMVALLKEATFLPEYVDERYLWHPDEMKMFNPPDTFTPEQYRAFVWAGGDQLYTGEPLGDTDFAQFSQSVINYWNNFQQGLPFEGPGLVKLEYAKTRTSNFDGKTDQELLSRRWDLRKEMAPDALDVMEDSATSSEETGNLAHLYDSAEEAAAPEEVSTPSETESGVQLGFQLSQLPTEYISPAHAFRYSKDRDALTFDSKLTPAQAGAMLVRVYQEEQRNRARLDEENKAVDPPDDAERAWLDKYKFKNLGDHLIKELPPDEIVYHYFHDLVESLPDRMLARHFGPKNEVFNPREFVSLALEAHTQNMLAFDGDAYLTRTLELLRAKFIEAGNSIDAFDSKVAGFSSEDRVAEGIKFFNEQGIYLSAKDVREASSTLKADVNSPVAKVARVISSLQDVPRVMSEMAHSIQTDGVPENRRTQFAQFKQMLYSWTQYTELRSQQYGANEQELLNHREQLMREFSKLKHGNIRYHADSEHLDPLHDSRDIGERMRVAIPVAHTNAVIAMEEYATQQQLDEYNNRGANAQKMTDLANTVDQDAPYLLHFNDTGVEWDNKVERYDRRLDQVLQNDWAFTTSSGSGESDETVFTHNYNEIDEKHVRRNIENDSTEASTDSWLFPRLQSQAEEKERSTGRQFHAHEEVMQMSEESWMVFMGKIGANTDLSIGKTMGKGEDFIGYEDLSFNPFDRWYTDEDGLSADEILPDPNNPKDQDEITRRDYDNEDDLRHVLPDYPSRMQDTIRAAYYNGYFDPEPENEVEDTVSSSGLGFDFGPDTQLSMERMVESLAEAKGPEELRNRHRTHRLAAAAKAAEVERKVMNDRVQDLQAFQEGERDAMRKLNRKELMPMESDASNKKYADLIRRGKMIREVDPAFLDIMAEDDPAEMDAILDDTYKKGSDENDGGSSEAETSDVSDMVSSAEEYVDATDQGETSSHRMASGSEQDSLSDSEAESSVTMPRGEGADPYYSIWKDYTSEEENPKTKGATNPLPEPSIAPDDYHDRDDFGPNREPPEWSAFNYTDPVQAAFFQEFNPHDFLVPQAEKYVYDSKDPHDRPWRLSDRVKKKMYELHQYNPSKWHARSLAALFKISSKRADAILKLQALEAQYVEEGFPLLSYEEAAEERIWPSADAIWDYPYVPVMNAAPPVRFADEVDVLDDIERIRRRQTRLHALGEQLSEIERDYHKDMGAYGETVPARIAPLNLDDTKFHPNRFSWVLTDISDIANNNFSIAVRDAKGHLREPNAVEYDMVRKKEKRQNEEFFYVQYREHYPELHKSEKNRRYFIQPPPVVHTRARSRRTKKKSSSGALEMVD
jgi:hypothetical protein